MSCTVPTPWGDVRYEVVPRRRPTGDVVDARGRRVDLLAEIPPAMAGAMDRGEVDARSIDDQAVALLGLRRAP